MRIIDFGHEFHIQWEFDHWHKRNLEHVKAIGEEVETNYRTLTGIDLAPTFVQAARYVVANGKKYWRIDGRFREQVLKLQETCRAQVVIPEELKPEEVGELPPMAELSITLPWKEGVQTRPYQDTGIAQAMKFKRCLIGDEQGLGKTLQSIGTMIGLEQSGIPSFPCLVICPSSTKLNWKREWEKFSHKKAIVLDSSMSAKVRKDWFKYIEHGMADVAIVNYESLASFCIESYPTGKHANGKRKSWKAADVTLKPFMSLFKSGILDESHRCKETTTHQSKFSLRIFSGLANRILLSGTPIVNKPKDLFAQLGILGTLNQFGGPKGFLDRYCEGGSGANNLRELNYKLNLNCFFRREKKEVAKDLPEKQRQTFLCDITTRAEYNKCKADFERFLRDNGCDDETVARRLRGEIMTQMMHLKQISARGKMNEVKEFVNEVLECGEKLILFCHLHEIVDACLELWPNAVTVTGRDSTEQRQANIDAFQNDPNCQLIICNHKAAGVGITLTASSRVAFIEYPWTYADCAQCEDRAHRIGQVNNVMCTYFLGQNTIDERMWEIISEKMAIGNAITGATDDMAGMEMIDKTLSMFKSENYDRD